MIAVLELLMFLIPWLVYSGVQLQRLPPPLACAIILPSFLVFVSGLIAGWLCALGVVKLDWPSPSLFVGNAWWHLATGPVAFVLYVLVMSEICRRKHSVDP
ncbi:hypothetical protein [Vibrio coralliilyticus]|uniref:Uncharacterized protein n=1 Tax=Vibrio coralliilyticus TaxID=190893 RepID=A0AAE5GJ93_9VIBR|nr:hypothetical protein [Vibrio coralliilyticus]AIW22946.1 hypothetical protein IX92_28380 [Vibrio coralliilyticus]NOH38283.1 hypothetical protein [Vibrio coralliilyticus]NOH55004.1 hypothetical protein [Vibrio coralliilyticus]NOI30334.1 hypothetical protein [Vibrio coralliilyticus]NOI49923.1 hypothetical protein [Vibrio coralliilyticus]